MLHKKLNFRTKFFISSLCLNATVLIYSLEPKAEVRDVSPASSASYAADGSPTISLTDSIAPLGDIPVTVRANLTALNKRASQAKDRAALEAVLAEFRELYNLATKEHESALRRVSTWSPGAAFALQGLAAIGRHDLVFKLDPTDCDHTYDPDRQAFQALKTEITGCRVRGESY